MWTVNHNEITYDHDSIYP